MNWLFFVFSLEMGILPQANFVMYQPDPQYVLGAFGLYTDLAATIEAYGFYAGGGMRCYMWATQPQIGFWPYQMTFMAEAGWRNDWLTIGFRHWCMHPIVPYLALIGPPPLSWEGGYEEIYVKIHGRLPLAKKR